MAFTEAWLEQHNAKMAALRVASGGVRVLERPVDATSLQPLVREGDTPRKEVVSAARTSSRSDPEGGSVNLRERPDAGIHHKEALRVSARAVGVTGGERPAPKSKVRRPEQDLQILQVEFLEWALMPPWRFLHIPNGGFRTPAEAKIMKAMGQKEGAADILFLGPEQRVVWVENKSEKGRLSKAQEGWRDWCRSVGIPWFVARSLEDLIAACHDAGVPLRVRAP